MRGTIIPRPGKKKLPNGKQVITYQVVVDIGLDENGKRKQKWKTFKTKREAEKYLNELVNQVDNGIYINPVKDTLEDYLNQWLNDVCKPNLSARTQELYSYMSRKHINPEIGHIALSELKPQDVQHLYSKKLSSGLSNRTVQLIHVTLHKALKNAVKTGMVLRNVCEAVDIPKAERREIRTMNEDDIQKFLEAARDTPYYALFGSVTYYV